MPLLTPEQCLAQCRVDGEYADAELASLLVAAEDAAAAHLNRDVFPDQATFDAALAEIPASARQAQADYVSALAAADAEADEAMASAIRDVALAKLSSSQLATVRKLNGIVANGSIIAAVRLTLGHLYANRESVAVGVSVAELPLGVAALLRPYRIVQMP